MIHGKIEELQKDFTEESVEIFKQTHIFDPLFQKKDGKTFKGEIYIRGMVYDDTDEDSLGSILQDYLKEYVEFAKVRQVSFLEYSDKPKNVFRYVG